MSNTCPSLYPPAVLCLLCLKIKTVFGIHQMPRHQRPSFFHHHACPSKLSSTMSISCLSLYRPAVLCLLCLKIKTVFGIHQMPRHQRPSFFHHHAHAIHGTIHTDLRRLTLAPHCIPPAVLCLLCLKIKTDILFVRYHPSTTCLQRPSSFHHMSTLSCPMPSLASLQSNFLCTPSDTRTPVLNTTW